MADPVFVKQFWQAPLSSNKPVIFSCLDQAHVNAESDNIVRIRNVL